MSAQMSDMSERVSNLLSVSILGELFERKFRFLDDLEGRMNPSSSITLFFLLLAVVNFGEGIFGEETDFHIGGSWKMQIRENFYHVPWMETRASVFFIWSKLSNLWSMAQNERMKSSSFTLEMPDLLRYVLICH